MFPRIHQMMRILHSQEEMVFNPLIPFLHDDLKVTVYERGNNVYVLINMPVIITENNRYHWAFRVLDKQLHLRGQVDIEPWERSDRSAYYTERRSEQLIKVIPLPSYVKRKPVSVDFENEWATIVLDRQDTVPTVEEWHTLNLTK
jgi:HSP20 family molecular chaperone IbpA